MARTKAQIRDETAFWLDDPKKTKFDNAFLDTLIGIAYPLVVAVVEAAGPAWNISQQKIHLTVVATQREYPFDGAYLVRRPITVHRVEGITSVLEVADNLGRTPLNLRPFSEGGVTVPYYPALDGRAVGEWVSLYRSTTNGEWVLKFEALEPRPQIVEIRFVPAIEALALDGQIPQMVPPDYHHLIGMRAAMLAKGTENRINALVFEEYQRAEQMMVHELASLRGHVSQRI